MNLISMKLDPPDADEAKLRGTLVSGDDPAYPWGLSIRLEDEQLEKLGISELPKPGETMILTARVEVTSTGLYDAKDGDEEKNMQLQITDMAVTRDRTETDVAENIYRGPKKSAE